MQYVYICYIHTHDSIQSKVSYTSRSRWNTKTAKTTARRRRLLCTSIVFRSMIFIAKLVLPRKRWKGKNIEKYQTCATFEMLRASPSLRTMVVLFTFKILYPIRDEKRSTETSTGAEISPCIAGDQSEDSVVRENVDNALQTVATLTLKKKINSGVVMWPTAATERRLNVVSFSSIPDESLRGTNTDVVPRPWLWCTWTKRASIHIDTGAIGCT